MAESPTPQTPFLGGGPKFNQAGNNAPLPGEHKAETPPPPPFGGPRMWFGGSILVLLFLALYVIWGQGLFGVAHVGSRGNGGASASDHSTDDLNPDSSQ